MTFETWVEQHYTKLLKECTFYVKNTHLAKDLCQETILRMLEGVAGKNWDANKAPLAYFKLVLRSVAADGLKFRQQHTMPLVEYLDGYSTSIWDTGHDTRKDILEQVVPQLTEAMQEIVYYTCAGMEPAQVARARGTKLPCVLAGYQAAVRHCRKIIAAQAGSSGGQAPLRSQPRNDDGRLTRKATRGNETGQ